jgi:ferric-dicitrate binding protein FerR (iron transport regulator)
MAMTQSVALKRTRDAFLTEVQAAEWLIRLEADASEANLAQWRHWLGENARHRAAYVRLERGWRETECLKRIRPLDGNVRLDLLDSFPGLPPVQESRDDPTALPRAKTPRRKARHYRKLAATTLVVILAAALMLAVYHLNAANG